VGSLKLRRFESVVNKLGIEQKAGTVLDVGCGNGRISLLVKKILPHMALVSMDISKSCVRTVKENVGNQVIVVDCTRLPLIDQSVSLIVCDQVIEHIEAQDYFVRELNRVLRKGGNIFVGSVLRKSHALSPYRNKEGKMILDPGHVKEFESIEQYINLLQNCFEVLEVSTEPIAFPAFITLYKILFTMGIIKFDLDVQVQRSNQAFDY
jgi:ubiquinone/menaquinone biosynthesis C-methylase UbiE